MCNCIYKYFVKLADSGRVIGISEHPLCTSFSRFNEMKLHLMCCIILYCIYFITYSAATKGVMFVYNYIGTVNKCLSFTLTTLICYVICTLTYMLHILNIHFLFA